MCIVHKVAEGYYGIETEDKPANLEVVALVEKAYREALAIRPKKLLILHSSSRVKKSTATTASKSGLSTRSQARELARVE